MSHLLREHSPITEDGWELLDSEARERLAPRSRPASWSFLRAARLAVFGDDLGRVKEIGDPPAKESMAPSARSGPGRAARALRGRWLRAPTPIAAPRTPNWRRSSRPPRDRRRRERRRLPPLKAAGITGIVEASPHDPSVGEDFERYPRHVAKAVDALPEARVDWPYRLALGPDPHTLVLEISQHGGYPLLEHLREIVGGPLFWSPGVKGGSAQHARQQLPLRVR